MKRKIAGSESREKSQMFRPIRPKKGSLGDKIMKYVLANFKFSWTARYGEDQLQACVVEAYQAAWQELSSSASDAEIKTVVNRIAGEIKRHEDREGLHTRLIVTNDDGKEVLLPDLVGKTRDLTGKPSPRCDCAKVGPTVQFPHGR